MKGFDPIGWWLVFGGVLVMTMVLLRAIGQGALQVALVMIDERRRLESQRKADNAAAEAAGRAAAMEPLNLNPDGTIEEPILAIVENSQN
ncbi:MAG: hypothetical protein FWD53_00490 [Phycisphaerales bacterium]|nr:hypothetical protein [Phycisphaerales bacterium]